MKHRLNLNVVPALAALLVLPALAPPAPGGPSGDRPQFLRGDGVFNIDASLAKNIFMPYNEKHTVQLRWEVFNVMNTVRFDPLNISLALGNRTNFGRYQGTLQPSRVMQLSLRYDF